VFLVAVAVGGMALAIFFRSCHALASKRIQAVTSSTKMPAKQTLRSRLMEDPKDTRRKQIQDSLNQLGEREKQRKKKLNLRTLIAQTGIDLSIKMFWTLSLVLGLVMAIVPFIFGLPWYVSVGAGVVGFLGLPRWFIKFLRTRRQNIFLNDFADAIDVMVRGLRSGLPVTDAMKIIANESGPPVGPEFNEVVEGQRIGIPVDQGIERMVERMPLAEVNFLAIVMAIQAKTGGNLSEALSNLSKVARPQKDEGKDQVHEPGSQIFSCDHWFTSIYHHGRPHCLESYIFESAALHDHRQHHARHMCGMDDDRCSGYAQNDQFRNLGPGNKQKC
jgi:tight adherence protein B